MGAEHFQNLTIGSAVAGKVIAWTSARQGQKTVVVERAVVGGSCGRHFPWPNGTCGGRWPTPASRSNTPRLG
jgi:hypothetical protein